MSGKNFINTMLEMSVDAGLDFLRTQAAQGQIPLEVPEISVVRTLCSLITAHLNIVSENGGFGESHSPNRIAFLVLRSSFLVVSTAS